MLLAIDAGNTNSVFAILNDRGQILQEWRTGTQSGRTADEYAVWFNSLLALDGYNLKDIDSAIIATVVPQGLFNLRTFCKRYLGIDPMVVDKDIDLGISIDLPDPSQVGADRLVNAVAGYHMYGGNLVIADFGTATTFDVISDKGAYTGGIICPGVNLSLDALHQAAAKLPRIAFGQPDEGVIGKNTVHAMQSGIYWGYVGLIEGMFDRIQDEIGEKMTLVATGGLASLFSQGTDRISEINRDLTIQGLYLIHKRNQRHEPDPGGRNI